MSSKVVGWLVKARDGKMLGLKKKIRNPEINSRKNQEMVNTNFLPIWDPVLNFFLNVFDFMKVIFGLKDFHYLTGCKLTFYVKKNTIRIPARRMFEDHIKT